MTDGKPDPLKLNPIIMMGASYYSLDEVVGNLFRTGLNYRKINEKNSL